MPSTRIVTGEWAHDREMELIEAVQSALVNAIKIPDWDRDIVVDLYDGKPFVSSDFLRDQSPVAGDAAYWDRLYSLEIEPR